MSEHGQFTMRGETGEDGSFRRQSSAFREWITSDGSTPYAPEAGRYHLYVSWACPWAHRTIIGRKLKGLEDVIGLSVVDPIRDARGWAFTGGEFTDPVNGFDFLSQAYEATDPGYNARHSVPVLWDKQTGRIVNNESADILRMFSTAFGDLATTDVDLYPEPLRDEIDRLNAEIYEDVNNAVYKAGFTNNQAGHEREVRTIFNKLDELDFRLNDSRYLFGDEPVETDWRLFTTLIRFDTVYYIHFKCSIKRLTDYRNLWPYLRDLYQVPGVAETVKMDQIKAHYYRTHPQINPQGLVPIGPEPDFGAPHDRA
jgi:putative glutathione S-transferase